MEKRFAMLGVAGYIAPKHLKAIKDTGGKLVAAFDTHDSVGILDSYFPDCDFFTEFERFERYLELKKRTDNIDYLVVCTPNYLHDSHIRLGLRLNADVICEKPIVINPKNLYALERFEQESRKRVFSILQLRLHPVIQKLRKEVVGNHKVELHYTTPRGNWYHYSWKGDENKSGGIAMNLGIHFFDMLIHLFGDWQDIKVFEKTTTRLCGYVKLKKADVNFTLSTKGDKSRKMTFDGKVIDFTEGFEDLHTKSYKNILDGNGFRIRDCWPSLELVQAIREYK